MLEADIFGTVLTFGGPMAASFLTTRYWEAADLGDQRRHLWFAFYLGVVLALLVLVAGTAAPGDRLPSVGMFFLVTIVATYGQEQRHLKRLRTGYAPSKAEAPEG